MTTTPQYRQTRFQAPAGSCELLLVRHGASEPHRPGERFPLTGGHGDPALAPEGRAQAAAVGARLAGSGERIDAVYVTTLRRTHETAAPLLDALGLEATVVEDLREVHLGEWEGGLFREKAASNDPIALRVFAERRWDVIPGAEPHEEFTGRVRRGVETIAAANADRLAIAFVHGGVIGAAMEIATGAAGFAFSGADNASITHLVITPERWIVRCFNDSGHLHPTFRTIGSELPL